MNLKSHIINKKEQFVKCIMWYLHKSKKVKTVLDKSLYKEYSNLLSNNVVYSLREVNIPIFPEKHKWVGGQWYYDRFYLIPNDATSIGEYKNEKFNGIGTLPHGLFKWTGSGIWKDKLYCFPRASNSFLCMDIKNYEISEIPLIFFYEKEHHYGGVITDNGIVFQPPRDTDHILVTNLNNETSHKIQLSSPILKMQFRYCGSIIHPNGYIYMFPEKNNKVIKLNPKTEEFEFIGKCVNSMTFDAKVWIDGNIYGFSAYEPGILKIHTDKNIVRMIHTNSIYGAYGTKLGVDGMLYSVPGDGRSIWRFDPRKDSVERIFDIHSEVKAKYAGGASTESGMIILTPAEAEKILCLVPNANKYKIQREVYKKFFVDNY